MQSVTKSPGDDEKYEFDWTDFLTVRGDSISGSTIELLDDDDGLEVDDDDSGNTSLKVFFTATGGQDRKSYRVQNVITTANERTYERTVIISVIQG